MKFQTEYHISDEDRLFAEIFLWLRKTFKSSMTEQLNDIMATLHDGLSGCNGFVTHRHSNGEIKNVCLSVVESRFLDVKYTELFFEMLNILSEFKIGIRFHKNDVTDEMVDLFYQNNWWLEKRSFLDRLANFKLPRNYAEANRFSKAEMPSKITTDVEQD